MHLQREIARLKKKILSLSAVVEENLHKTSKAIERRDSELAREVIRSDKEVDQLEVDVEEDCLKILALHQPVAADLRFLVAVLKMNADLERIGDLTVNIAERVESLTFSDEFDFPPAIPQMVAAVESMLRRVLRALVDLDDRLAEEVRDADDAVDELHSKMYRFVELKIRESAGELLEPMIRLLDISRYLERIADHCTNIAEDVIYMTHGDIVRHKGRWDGRDE